MRALRHFGSVCPALAEVALGDVSKEPVRPPRGVFARLLQALECTKEDLACHLEILGGRAEDSQDSMNLAMRLRDAAGGKWGMLASYWAGRGGSQQVPRCICQRALVRNTVGERIQR